MSYANILYKILDLEKKLNLLSENSNTVLKDVGNDEVKNLEISNNSFIIKELTERIVDLEKNNNNELIRRIENIENIHSNSDISNRLFAIENKPILQNNIDINNLIERLNKLELQYVSNDSSAASSAQLSAHLSDRILNIENNKYISQLPQLFEHVNVIDCKYIPPDLTERINNLEIKLGFQ